MAADKTKVIECGEDGCTTLQLFGKDIKHITDTVNDIKVDVKDLKRLHSKVTVLFDRLPSKTASATIGGGAGGAIVIIAEIVKVLLK